ncbi:MAG: hypothetical protein ACOVNV_11480, partial [Pirellulaceae bacterium]
MASFPLGGGGDTAAAAGAGYAAWAPLLRECLAHATLLLPGAMAHAPRPSALLQLALVLVSSPRLRQHQSLKPRRYVLAATALAEDRGFEATAKPNALAEGLRFDPTPAGSGSNAGVAIREPQRATFDFVEHLWKRYVIDMDRSHQTPLMEELSRSSKGIYRQYYQRLHEWLESSLPKMSGGSKAVWIDRAIVGALFLLVPAATGLVLLGWIASRVLWSKLTGPPARQLLSDQRVRWATGILPLMESMDREVCRKGDSETLSEWLDRVLDAWRSQSVSPASIDAVRSFLASYMTARYGVSIPAETTPPSQLPN